MDIVYFVRRANGDIKIGTTSQYHARMRTLVRAHGALEVLGVMAGGSQTEKALHSRFAVLRRQHLSNSGRPSLVEWFAPAPELMDFIAAKTVRPSNPFIGRASMGRPLPGDEKRGMLSLDCTLDELIEIVE